MNAVFANEYYGQLVGFTIKKFRIERDEFGSSFPVFIMERNGDKVKVSLSSDEEGNDGGFAFIEGAE